MVFISMMRTSTLVFLPLQVKQSVSCRRRGQVKFTVRPIRAYPAGVNVQVDIPRNSILSLVGADEFTLDANSTSDFEEVILTVAEDDNSWMKRFHSV